MLYPAFLLAPGLWPKVAVLALLGLFNSGWYAIFQAQPYSALPGKRGTALAVTNVSGLVASIVPLLLVGPVALLIGLRRVRPLVNPED